jgi:hypothetical protein
MISPALWGSRQFHSLSDKAKVVFLYLLTNAHMKSPGCYTLPDGYAATDLECDVEVYRAMRAEIQKAGLIDFDPEKSVIFIEKWLKHNAPQNGKHAISLFRFVDDIASERLRQKTLDTLVPIDDARKAANKDKRGVQTELGTEAALGSDGRLVKTPFMQGRRR